MFAEAFNDELSKLAVQDPEERKRKARMRYRQNREEILRRGQMYRKANAGVIARKKKRYRDQLSAGARKSQKRVDSGVGYNYMGYW